MGERRRREPSRSLAWQQFQQQGVRGTYEFIFHLQSGYNGLQVDLYKLQGFYAKVHDERAEALIKLLVGTEKTRDDYNSSLILFTKK